MKKLFKNISRFFLQLLEWISDIYSLVFESVPDEPDYFEW